MELHEAIKKIVLSKGTSMIKDLQIINYLSDYQAFSEKPATKQILRAFIEYGYAESILSLVTCPIGWETKLKKYFDEFDVAYGFKKSLSQYVFNSITYGIGLTSIISLEFDDNDLKNDYCKEEHILFNELSLDCNVIHLATELENIGYYFDRRESGDLDKMGINIAHLKGKFENIKRCAISIHGTYQSHKVWHVDVEFPLYEPLEKNNWETIKKRYSDLKQKLSCKYGAPHYCKEVFQEPYYDGCGNEMAGIGLPESYYECGFLIPGGEIILYWGGISYTDNKNYELYKLEKDSL